MIKPEKLDFYIKNGLNILIDGKHGVGKSTIVLEAFKRNNLKYKYFSAATMDTWVDFVGIPKEMKNENNESYLELVRPKEFQNDEIEALFFDEFSRGSKKIRNSVMELIQFKSINGKKFNNLKIIWAAINPDDETMNYDVEKLDPAQKDRFHIWIDIPYKPDKTYFTKKYGKELATSALSWWNQLTKKAQDIVSPRRLDYALEMFQINGDLEDVLPHESNVQKLKQVLHFGPARVEMNEIFKKKDTEKAIAFIDNENNYSSCIEFILKDDKLTDFFVPLMPKEKISELLSENEKIQNYIVNSTVKHDIFVKIIRETLTSSTNTEFSIQLRKKVNNNEEAFFACFPDSNTKKVPQSQTNSPQTNSTILSYANPIFNENATQKDFNTLLNAQDYKNFNSQPTPIRIQFYKSCISFLPFQMNKEDAQNILEKLCDIGNNARHSSLLNTYKDLIGLINHCVLETHRNTNETISDIYDRIEHLKRLRMRFSAKKVLNGLYNSLLKYDHQLVSQDESTQDINLQTEEVTSEELVNV